jgi:glycosyltransferase involved in cell wall biosynthesis
MPEMRHNENALLGNDIAEIADLVAMAMSDAPLRRRLGEAGYATFVDLFTAPIVARSIVDRIKALDHFRAQARHAGCSIAV